MQFVDTYREVKSRSGSSLRERVRCLALDVLSKMESPDLSIRPRVQLLYIHHTFQDEMDRLVDLVDHLSSAFEFVPHSEAVDRIYSGKIDRPYVSLSSDDGFKNNLLAAELLAERGISACFFINPLLIDETDPGKIGQHCRTRLNFPPVEFLTWKDVEHLKTLGHEIGSHTMNHMNIGQESKDKVEEDLGLSYEILMKRCGEADHFAWPYGRFTDFNEHGRRTVFDTGFRSCASAERGCHVNKTVLDPQYVCLRRDHVILDWKPRHIHYFLQKSAKNASMESHRFPY